MTAPSWYENDDQYPQREPPNAGRADYSDCDRPSFCADCGKPLGGKTHLCYECGGEETTGQRIEANLLRLFGRGGR
jgi:hypothetical protein